jgi:bifunctional polynucleotide phosphatase/kinase
MTSSWTRFGSLLIRSAPSCANANSKRVFLFDLDSTLIVTKSGNTFAKSAADWAWFDESVPLKLQELHRSGVRLVIVTNQAGIHARGRQFSEKKAATLMTKIDDVVAASGVPLLVFVATTNDAFRKPNREIWDLFVRDHCEAGVDVAECAFVGDAAGRKAGWNGAGAKRDFSNSDRQFAANCGLPFHTPEALFLGLAEATEWVEDAQVEAVEVEGADADRQ